MNGQNIFKGLYYKEISRLREGSCPGRTTNRHTGNSVVLVKEVTKPDNVIPGLAT